MSLQRPVLITTFGDGADFYFGRGFVVVAGPTHTDIYLNSGRRAFATLRGKRYERFRDVLQRAEASAAEGNILDAMRGLRRRQQPVMLAVSARGQVSASWHTAAPWRDVVRTLREEVSR